MNTNLYDAVHEFFGNKTEPDESRFRQYQQYALCTLVALIVIAIVAVVYFAMRPKESASLPAPAIIALVVLFGLTGIISALFVNANIGAFGIDTSEEKWWRRSGLVISALFFLYIASIMALIFASGGSRSSVFSPIGLINVALGFGFARSGRIRMLAFSVPLVLFVLLFFVYLDSTTMEFHAALDLNLELGFYVGSTVLADIGSLLLTATWAEVEPVYQGGNVSSASYSGSVAGSSMHPILASGEKAAKDQEISAQRKEAVLRHLEEHGTITAKDVSAMFGLSRNSASWLLATLVDEGYIERDERGAFRLPQSNCG